MSRIPKLPISKKENLPGSFNSRSLTLNKAASNLTDADKKNLLLNHTRPIRNIPTTSTTVPALRVKKANSVPAPAKITKVERKQTVAPKIAPYDYKARFNNLLEKHKVIKDDYGTLKEEHDELSCKYDTIKDEVVSTTLERDTLKEKLSSTLTDLNDERMEKNKVKSENVTLKNELEDTQRQNAILREISESFKKKSAEFDNLQSDFQELNRRHVSLKEEAEALRVLSEHLKKVSIDHDRLQLEYKEAQEVIAKFKNDIEFSQNLVSTMYMEQRTLRNTVQDLKGNIRVYCRIRPTLESEASKTVYNLSVLDGCSIEVEKIELNSNSMSSRKGKQQQSFTFDGIFTPHISQDDVFAEVSPMIQSALDGYNVCIFAYGQTGSGKTYTMEGGYGREEYGIIPRAIEMIFSCMDVLKRMGWILTLRASFMEIYNETIYDLLTSSKDQVQHEIKMVNSKGNDVYVSNLKEEEVRSAQDFIKLLIFAQRNRQTAATINNERSSRSHSVTQIKISAINEKRKEKFTSNLNLVDLAGSESGKTTQRMDETKHINRSLSELSKVIISLQTNQSHIPYRNSKLTHLLMPSLGGNSKTLMLVNINQLDEAFSETLNSLRFATKVNGCRTTKAKKNLTLVDHE